MPEGDKRSYTSKQKRQAQHIEEGYNDHGVPNKAAEARAWATVNKTDGGGKKSGSGRGRKTKQAPSCSSRGGASSARRTAKPRSRTLSSPSGDGSVRDNYELMLQVMYGSVFFGPGDYLGGAKVILRYNFVPPETKWVVHPSA